MSENSNSPRPQKAGFGFRNGFFGCLGVVAAIVMLLFVVQCTLSNVGKSAIEATKKAEADRIAKGETWTYTTAKDQMTDAVTQSACTTSANKVTQDLPFDDTDAQLCVRKDAKGTSVLVVFTRVAHIQCDNGSCAALVRFDAAPAQEFKVAKLEGGQGGYPFVISDGSKFIDALKGSTKTLVQLDFFVQSKQSLVFNTKG